MLALPLLFSAMRRLVTTEMLYKKLDAVVAIITKLVPRLLPDLLLRYQRQHHSLESRLLTQSEKSFS